MRIFQTNQKRYMWHYDTHINPELRWLKSWDILSGDSWHHDLPKPIKDMYHQSQRLKDKHSTLKVMTHWSHKNIHYTAEIVQRQSLYAFYFLYKTILEWLHSKINNDIFTEWRSTFQLHHHHRNSFHECCNHNTFIRTWYRHLADNKSVIINTEHQSPQHNLLELSKLKSHSKVLQVH